MHSSPTIRSCAVCGMFYPSDAVALQAEVRELLGRVPPSSIEGTVRGLISPHAGYRYSGFTAAHGYALLRGSRYRTVVIVSPSHREYFDGISVYPGDGYQTPLGIVPVNENVREALISQSSIVAASMAGHGEEHAIEVQLPFLQEVLGEFDFVPLVIGDQRREYCLELARVLSGIEQEEVLLIASTDLSHYHPSAEADKLDDVMATDIDAFNADKLMDDLNAGRTEACGGGPSVAVMAALRKLGVKNMRILHRSNSGDITGERHHVVGYLSAAAIA